MLIVYVNHYNIDYVSNILHDSDGKDWDIRRYNFDKLRYYTLYKYSKETVSISEYKKI